ncbi:MAG: sel1 repeat family protein [Desulfovibrio sp.]|nr:sel1 repeat family protein [Desulfovibrio sp.]
MRGVNAFVLALTRLKCRGAALLLFAVFCVHGSILESIPAQAETLAETMRAAEEGDGSAANRLGVWYEKGKNGLAKNAAKAVFWYRKGASRGNIYAMHNLGDCYLHHVGVPFDARLAFAWYRKTAEMGGGLGYEDLGRFFITHGFEKPNSTLAKVWLTAAARQGRTNAQEMLLALGGEKQEVEGPRPPCQRTERGRKHLRGTIREIVEDKEIGELIIRIEQHRRLTDVLVWTDVEDKALSAILADNPIGKSVSLETVRTTGLQTTTAQCVTVCEYIPHTIHREQTRASARASSESGVDIYIGVSGLLLGANLDGTWVDADTLQNDPDFHAKRFQGGLKGDLYSKDAFLCECSTGQLINEQPPENVKEYGSMADVPLFVMQTADGVYKVDKEPVLFLGSPHKKIDPFPRRPRYLTSGLDIFEQDVRTLLLSEGLKDPSVSLKSVCAVDMDGDGKEEYVVHAENFLGHTSVPMTGERGMYSLVFVVREVSGERLVSPLAQYICHGRNEHSKEGAVPALHKPVFICDVNGDGLLEVVLSSTYYEGRDVILFVWQGKDFLEVLREGLGT